MKIASISPNPSDATSLYRCAGPLARMQKDYEDVSYVEFGSVQLPWHLLSQFDILFIQRPHKLDHLLIIKKAKYLGLKIWVDFDDLLWNLPEHHPLYLNYMADAPLNDMFKLLKELPEKDTLVTVSTQGLKANLNQVNDKLHVVVVPNALDDRWMIPKPTKILNGEGKLGWRGGKTHDIDLMNYRNEIRSLKYPIEWIGFLAPSIRYPDPNHQHIIVPPMETIDYFRFLYTQRNWKAFFVCLEENEFNYCKSNIAYLEATYAGALCVAPAWPDWELPGVLTYRNKEEFTEQINIAMELSAQDHKYNWEKAKSYVKEYSLTCMNYMRFHELTNLLNQ